MGKDIKINKITYIFLPQNCNWFNVFALERENHRNTLHQWVLYI